MIGGPGASSALIIAGRCGIPKGVLERAEQFLGKQHFEVQELIEKMKESHRELSDKIQPAPEIAAAPPARPRHRWIRRRC